MEASQPARAGAARLEGFIAHQVKACMLWCAAQTNSTQHPHEAVGVREACLECFRGAGHVEHREGIVQWRVLKAEHFPVGLRKEQQQLAHEAQEGRAARAEAVQARLAWRALCESPLRAPL